MIQKVSDRKVKSSVSYVCVGEINFHYSFLLLIVVGAFLPSQPDPSYEVVRVTLTLAVAKWRIHLVVDFELESPGGSFLRKSPILVPIFLRAVQ